MDRMGCKGWHRRISLLAVTGAGEWIVNHVPSVSVTHPLTTQTTESGSSVLHSTISFEQLTQDGYAVDRVQDAPDGHSQLIFTHNNHGTESLFVTTDGKDLIKIATNAYEAIWYNQSVGGQDPLFAVSYGNGDEKNPQTYVGLFKFIPKGVQEVDKVMCSSPFYYESEITGVPNFTWDTSDTEVTLSINTSVTIGNGSSVTFTPFILHAQI